MTNYAGEFPIAVHPGDILQEMLDERGITQMLLAKHLDTDVARINEICRHRRGISAQMAVPLGKAFGTSAADRQILDAVATGRVGGRRGFTATTSVDYRHDR